MSLNSLYQSLSKILIINKKRTCILIIFKGNDIYIGYFTSKGAANGRSVYETPSGQRYFISPNSKKKIYF
jgi:hypothetical protein